MPQDDQGKPRSCQSHIQSFRITGEPHVIPIGSDTGQDDDFFLLTLEAIDGIDVYMPQNVARKSTDELVLDPPRCSVAISVKCDMKWDFLHAFYLASCRK